MAVWSWLIPKDDIDATKSAAQDDSAHDPKRSEPFPTMSMQTDCFE